MTREIAPEITVVTITRTRPDLLEQALESVERQECEAAFDHLVLVDACADTAAMLAERRFAHDLHWELVPRAPGEHSGPGRSSLLRNLGVAQARGRYIAFIDDDNRWADNHLSSLLALARESGSAAVHSAMRMFHRDGRPYRENRVPWDRDPARAEEKYAELVQRGVAARDDNLFLDRADPLDISDGVRSVDTGEWLIRRELLARIPFRTEFSVHDEAELVGEDDKLLHDILAAGVRPPSTGLPTLQYFVGGYSNNFGEDFDDSFSWATQK